jgi:hypothetical protein
MAGENMKQVIEILWNNYILTHDLIKFSDTKAAAILAADGVIALIIFANISNIKDYIVNDNTIQLLFIIGTISYCGSFFFAVLSIIPITQIDKENSILFFGHIAKNFKSSQDYENNAIKKLGEDNALISEICQEIWIDSLIAQKKYALVSWSLRLLGATFLICIINIGIYTFS